MEVCEDQEGSSLAPGDAGPLSVSEFAGAPMF